VKDFTLELDAEEAKVLLTAMQDYQRDMDGDSIDPDELLRLYQLHDTEVIQILGRLMESLWLALVEQADEQGLPRPKPPWYDPALL
tara:strand:- start:164 stop:421 length:258 start_codon:yes stop_codon:yes gene_type:complete